MRNVSKFLEQSLRLATALAVFWHTPGYSCDKRFANNIKEIKWHSDRIAGESAELKRVLEVERPPLAAHVQTLTQHLDSTGKRVAKTREMLSKLEAATKAGRDVFLRLTESSAYRTQLGESLEIIFRSHEANPGDFDKHVAALGPEIRTALGPLLQATDVSSKTLMWTVGLLLLQACKADDSRKISQGQETFTSIYEEFGRHFENQLLDDKKSDELNRATLKDAQGKLATVDARISALQSGIQKRQAIRAAAEAENANMKCVPISPRDYPT